MIFCGDVLQNHPESLMSPDPIVRGLLPAERLLFRTQLVAIGDFRCRPNDDGFGGGTPCTSWCFVFPRTSVWIQHEGRPRFVADPSIVTFYNRDDRYRRSSISADGDRADWFAVAPSLALDAAAIHDPAVAERPDRPFRFDRGPSDAAVYLAQRAVYESVHAGRLEALAVDEAVVGLLDAVLSRTYMARGTRQSFRGARRSDLVDRAQAVLGTNLADRIELGPLARKLGVSPYYLCRTFRHETGSTLGDYRLNLRLRMSLERIAAGQPLTDLALELGFSSHSHFTARFRKVFGFPPSRLRGMSMRRLNDACGDSANRKNVIDAFSRRRSP
jgi:AraC family transcriptional regulator